MKLRLGDVLRQSKDLYLWFSSLNQMVLTHKDDLYVFAGPEVELDYMYANLIHMNGEKLQLQLGSVKMLMGIVND